MTAYPQLSERGEEAWLNLRYHVEWPSGFALIFLFSSNPALQNLFCERLAKIYQTRVSHLQRIAPKPPASLTEEIMALIRFPAELLESAAAPLWLDLSMDNDAAWKRSRDNLIARLNEHRDLLRSRLHRPVILVLPAGYRQRLRELAPDLWSIRNFSLDLREVELSSIEKATAEIAAPRPGGMAVPVESITLSAFGEALLSEWQRLKQRGAEDRGVVLAGWDACEAALAARQLKLAAQIAHEVLELARKRVKKDDTPETVRDLSIALDNIGDTARALGRLEEAEAAYRESLALMRLQRERLGDTPETVRDLSVSLDNVGDTAQALGRLEEAEAAYEEALLLCHRLNLAFPDMAEHQTAIEFIEQKLAEIRGVHSQADSL